jgi:hypothetical protein
MKLAITSIQRNRGPWIAEWVAFHYLVGFKKFFIYTHLCSDNTENILNNLKGKIDIQIFQVGSEIKTPQLKCYRECYKKFGDEIDWMAFIDGDEFLFPTSTDTMEKVLEEYSDKNISALGVYWSCFGSNGYIEEPSGLIIENYRYRAEDGYKNNRHIKSIVQGREGESVRPFDPHYFKTPHGTFDENLKLITAGLTGYEPTYDKLRVNHYVTQSRSFFLNFKSKVEAPDGTPRRNESFWQEHDKNDVLDNSMQKFIKPLKDILKNG